MKKHTRKSVLIIIIKKCILVRRVGNFKGLNNCAIVHVFRFVTAYKNLEWDRVVDLYLTVVYIMISFGIVWQNQGLRKAYKSGRKGENSMYWA